MKSFTDSIPADAGQDVEEISATTMRIGLQPDAAGATQLIHPADLAGIMAGEAEASDSVSSEPVQRSEDYRRLLQSIYDAVLITDMDGRIVDFNSRAVDFLLCDPAALHGASILDFISGAGTNLLDAIKQNLASQKYTLIEAYCVRNDETTFPAEVAVNHVGIDPEGELCFSVRNVTRRKRAQEALEEAVQRLEEHDRARSQFVGNVSHELRTPLTSMTYAISNLLRGVMGPVPERVAKYLEILDGDCKRLLGTVNDILDLRKMESKTLVLHKARVPLTRLVRGGAGSLVVQCERKKIRLVINHSHQWFVDVDSHKLERVFLNVVGNAVKFTPEGGTITVDVAKVPGADAVVVHVTDTGIGIPPEAIPYVTDRYFTVGEQASGCGLGLSISKEIIEYHGGALKLASPAPGQTNGTQVSITLPLAEPPTLLIADDEANIRDMMSGQLAKFGYRIATAADGEEALARVHEIRPDLVVVDLAMPRLDGTQFILKMKSEGATMRIPIIVVTGAAVGRAKAEIMNSFSIPAIGKPWEEAELLDCVEDAFLGAASVSRGQAQK